MTAERGVSRIIMVILMIPSESEEPAIAADRRGKGSWGAAVMCGAKVAQQTRSINSHVTLLQSGAEQWHALRGRKDHT